MDRIIKTLKYKKISPFVAGVTPILHLTVEKEEEKAGDRAARRQVFECVRRARERLRGTRTLHSPGWTVR